ncbi:MAG: zinc ribbon domain-containing protein [Acidobacteriia bacterium]|nr:zinc ribbon domain-containing protein [Terriglobia bacterium]
MPLYEYKCDKCGEVFEVIEKFSDEPLQVHEKCGGAVQRLISTSALQFKGSGWYVTDYARGGQRSDKSDSAAKTSTTDTSAKTEGKPSESKPAETKPASSESKNG